MAEVQGDPAAGLLQVYVSYATAQREFLRPMRVEPGTTVTLEMRGLGEMTGTVAWWTQGRLGIALDRPIDPSRARKPVGTGTTTPNTRRRR